MAQVGTRTVAIHQVTEGRRPLREVGHPLAPELLVAEMAGELPPDVARAVRQHADVCALCGALAQSLAASYDALGSLGEEPVPYVPDLRRSVRLRLEGPPAHERAWHAARQFGGGTLALLCAILALVLVVGLGIATSVVHAPVVLGRSRNGIVAPPAAGTGAVLYAQTAKLVDVRDSAGRAWPVAEVIVVDEQTGRVVRSLPAGGANLRAAAAGASAAALTVSVDGTAVFELTSTQTGGQALVAIDTQSGAIRWIDAVTLPDGQQLGAGMRASAVAVAPDGQTVYVGLEGAGASGGSPRALAVEAATGRVVTALTPTMPATVPLLSAGVPLTTFTPAAGARVAQAAGGALAISPDGTWLLDVTNVTDATGTQTALVRQFSATTGATGQVVALRGDFRLAALTVSPDAASPYVYLATGGAAGQVYILSSELKGLTLVGQVPLGGPAAAANAALTGTISVSPTADGTQAYVSADVSAGSASIASHDVWLVDGAAAAAVTHRVPFLGAGDVLANWAGGTNGQIFDLVDGEVYVLAPSLSAAGNPTAWLRVADGQPVVALVGTGPAA
jgi:hypothetical protein